MNEVKIQIPDNCELIKNGDTYVVREKKQGPPRSWEEFCKNYPKQREEVFIDNVSYITISNTDCPRDYIMDRNVCTSKEEAEAFLALMQLRQLRKAWVGDWTYERNTPCAAIKVNGRTNQHVIWSGYWDYINVLSFPTIKIAEDFLNCFKNLCETAKILL